ncbi:Hvo_1808 family surface protein [Natronosalvus halobius]|uniref:Hvo_1808 family surface protein n=1 Tax=Natronosalvus halobius TaxID=2953746 RepID=UPI00209CF596|nr:Hvo_1808 family surface protein [Natronosalvus halobius]USZ71323.1 Hvo_1808 family surface protein [Natronosalvus halobius]
MRTRGHFVLVTVGLTLLVVLAGCAAPLTAPSDAPASAERDLGTIYGYNATSTLDVDDPARLSPAELEAVTYRAMARLEEIRGLRYTENVEVEVWSREELREWYGESEPADAFTNELWRAAFVVDGETDVNAAFDSLYGDSVLGFYVDDRIVVVTDDPDADRLQIDRTTLVHELAHALQDQQFGLERRGTTVDARRAENGLIEGEATLLAHRYEQRCRDDPAWECLPETSDGGLEGDGGSKSGGEPSDGDDAGETSRSLNVGLYLSIYAPYAEGPTFVQSIYDAGGWDAVDAAFTNRPTSTSQLVHPERYPDDRPVDLAVDDRSSPAWSPITDDNGETRTETVGEATLFGALWANGVLDHSLLEEGSELSPYNYSHPATAGWAGDTFVAYEATDGGSTDDEIGATGHVWALEFRTPAAADRFASAYERVLENRGAEAVAGNGTGETYRIGDDEPFAGAYRIEVDDTRVELVGAPTVGDLEAIRPADRAAVTASSSLDRASPAPTGVPTALISRVG